jgi:hypothetical protein
MTSCSLQSDGKIWHPIELPKVINDLSESEHISRSPRRIERDSAERVPEYVTQVGNFSFNFAIIELVCIEPVQRSCSIAERVASGTSSRLASSVLRGTRGTPRRVGTDGPPDLSSRLPCVVPCFGEFSTICGTFRTALRSLDRRSASLVGKKRPNMANAGACEQPHFAITGVSGKGVQHRQRISAALPFLLGHVVTLSKSLASAEFDSQLMEQEGIDVDLLVDLLGERGAGAVAGVAAGSE